MTMVSDSMITGFTLPGMMLEPGCVSGRRSSPSPAIGPVPISRMSEPIFHRLVAMVRSAPWAATTTSSVACAWKWLGLSRIGRPAALRLERFAQQVERRDELLFDRQRRGDLDRGGDHVVR